MKALALLALALVTSLAEAVSIDAVYFGQTHVLKATDTSFGLVGNREALIKVHVTDPAAPASPAVTATLSLNSQTLVVNLTGPATLPAAIPDGPGVVQHAFANTFTGYIPAAWMKKGLQVTVNAGAASTTVTDMKVSAPTKVVMTMTDVHYFAQASGDYPANTFAEIEAKWPVADLELRRLRNVVFRELVIPPRSDVGAEAVRLRSKAEYQAQTGLGFDGEQAAALEWNGALKRAAGISGRWSLYYLNVYNAAAGGQAGGFAGVGNGTSVGILHHELGHALSLPHWGDNAAYPYKGDMHGIQAPTNYNETHAGPAWGFDLRTKAFIPPTVQAGNVGAKPTGTYKVDPMQGGGTGWQEPAYLMNHFSDYSVNQMRGFLNSHVVVWNPALNNYAQWNQTAGDYTTTVGNNGIQFPQQRDVQVISILASMSGAKPAINMVYPPIGPYTSGLIRLFDPAVAADRTAADSIFSPTNGSDYCVRVVQGGVTKTYMLAASALTSPALTSAASLETEALNLPAADGPVTRIELLSTPNAEVNGLPANPAVLYTWAPLMPATAAFDSPPSAGGSTAVTMTAQPGEVEFGQSGGTVEYQFTETSGNPGATSSAWQSSRSYTDNGLQPGTPYTYTVSMRAGALSSATSAPASATTQGTSLAGSITVDSTEPFTVASGSGYKAATNLGTFDAAGADKLVVVIGQENANNDATMTYGVRYNGIQMIEAVQQNGSNRAGSLAIYYLDNPGPVGTGITVSGYNPNGGLGTAYALNGTRPGFGASNSRTGTATTSVPLTTSATNSLVIAALQNSGSPNSAGTPAASSPLTQSHAATWGSQWGSLATGHQQVAAPGNITPTFTTSTGSSYSINLAAVEFPAATTPSTIWTQTAGGAQSWTTAANWIGNSVPSPASGDTADFSSVDLAADTTLTLAANRTAQNWIFGDTGGNQNWIVNPGSTLTLAGTTPGIAVVNNSATLNNPVAGTAGLTKSGTGSLVLNGLNTYTGTTNLRQGTLQINTLKNFGSASSLGAPSSGSIALATTNSSTLHYTGSGDTTNRSLQIGPTGSAGVTATVANNGSGPLVFTAAAFNTPVGITAGSAPRTLALSGSFGTPATPNEIQGVIADNTLNGATAPASRISLTKSGTGTWRLSAANTYTGNTTLSAGTLVLGANHVLPASPVSIGNATLDAATRSDATGPLDPTAAATLHFGPGAALAFADSSAVDWSGGTLALTGTFVSGTSLRFGTTASGLTSTQLSLISAPGIAGFTLDAAGYLIGIPANSYAAWQSANSTAGAFDQDHDGDGVPNGIEFFLGGTTRTTGPTALPSVTRNAGTLAVTWTKAATYPGTFGLHFRVETSDSLAGTWTDETPGGNVTLTGSTVKYTFPSPLDAKRFVRLRVTGP